MFNPSSIILARGGRPVSAPDYRSKPIDYIDPSPQPFKVQIGLVEYFERITKLKTDNWQKHFLNYLQNAVENMHVKSTWAEFHAEAQLGKTRGLSQIFPTWCFGHAPLFRYTLAMYNISRSTSHADVIIQIMRSQMYRDIFPSNDAHLPKFASKDGFMTNARRDVEGGRMDAQKSLNPVGLESGMTGSSTDWLTIDDPYKEPKDAFSVNMWENLDRFWKYGVIPRMLPHTCVAAMFHRYSYDDFGGYLLNTGKFDYVRYATIADGPYIHDETGQRFEDPLGRADGELICPERRPLSYYSDKFDDEKVKLSMFQGRPGKDEGDFFKVGMIETVTDEPRRTELWTACSLKARGWDHAATQGGGDNSAGGLMGFMPDETVLIGDVFSGQLDSANRVARQQEIAAADGPDVTVVVPEGISADGKDNVFMMRQNLKEFNVVARKVTNAAPGSDAKKRRAYNFSIAVNAGRVKFLDGPWVERVKMLMRRFGSSTSGDDEIDALSDAYNHLYEEFHKGLVIKSFSVFQLWEAFAEKFGHQIPAHWHVYAALKISADASLPNSGIVVARAAENSGLKDTLFIIDEYKEYTANYDGVFAWLDTALSLYCAKPEASVIWMHPDSEGFMPTIRHQLRRYAVRLFKEGENSGIVEANWYAQNDKLIGLIRDPLQLSFATDHLGLKDCRQEAFTWGFDDKGQPNAIGQVWNCLRMITHLFRTDAEPLTREEAIQKHMPAHLTNDVRPYRAERDLEVIFARKEAAKLAKDDYDDIQEFDVYG